MYQLILKNFAMHIKLDDEEAAWIQSNINVRPAEKKTVVLESGSVCRNIYFVNQGCLRVYYTDTEGQEHNIMFCPSNWWAVDIASFSEQRPAFYSIGALEKSELFYFSFKQLEEIYIRVPKMERFFRILTQNGFSIYQNRIVSNLSKTAEERYQLFQELYPDLELRIAQKEIASYLGITPVFLSMLRNKRGKKV